MPLSSERSMLAAELRQPIPTCSMLPAKRSDRPNLLSAASHCKHRLHRPHLLLVVLVGQLPLLMLQTCPPDLCRAQLTRVGTSTAALYFRLQASTGHRICFMLQMGCYCLATQDRQQLCHHP